MPLALYLADLRRGGRQILDNIVSFVPSSAWWWIHGIDLLLPLVIIIVAATVIVRLAQDMRHERLERLAQRARWLAPVIVLTGALVFNYPFSPIWSMSNLVNAMLIGTAVHLAIGVALVTVWLRVLWKLARALRPFKDA